MPDLNETHSAALRSWLASAHAPDSDFPIQNLPFGVFRRRGSGEPFRGGVAIGDAVFDLAAAHAAGLFDGEAAAAAGAAAAPTLNALMARGPRAWSALRLALSRVLRVGASAERTARACLVPQTDAELGLPAQVGDYTDFYTSIHHATRVGRQFRPDNPLLPNFKWVPIGYHGRTSSLVVSGHDVVRPVGQLMLPGADRPQLAPCRRLDFELELAIWVGPGNVLGERIDIGDADAHVFGIGLLNDWSARDIQSWEYQPLGPFLGKNFLTTVSPWIVTLEALAPFRVPFTRPEGDPPPLAYLDSPRNRIAGAIDIRMEASIETAAMCAAARAPVRLARTSYRHAYWTVAQMVAHHTVGGCNLQPGDLFGSGTQSGPAPEESGSMLELSEGGQRPFALPGGETRGFLEDGDDVILHAHCEREGFARIGFGTCRGVVRPARAT